MIHALVLYLALQAANEDAAQHQQAGTTALKEGRTDVAIADHGDPPDRRDHGADARQVYAARESLGAGAAVDEHRGDAEHGAAVFRAERRQLGERADL